MEFIVSLFKYIILGFCFLLLTGIVLGLFYAIDGGLFTNGQAAIGVISGLVIGAIFFILCMGGLAILISIHDRHRELAEGVHLIADELKRIADQDTQE